MKKGSVRANSATHASLFSAWLNGDSCRCRFPAFAPDAPAPMIVGVDDGDRDAVAREEIRGTAAVDAGADDDDVGVGH